MQYISGKSIIVAAIIMAAGTATAAEPDRMSDGEITDAVIREAKRRAKADREARAEAAEKDRFYIRDTMKGKNRLEGTDAKITTSGNYNAIQLPKAAKAHKDEQPEEFEVQYEPSIVDRRNNAPGFIQIIIDAWDFLTGWCK